ncbi:MAG TPA: hypothetical protein VEP73_08410 [Actinomycetota bacterium]|nr:hypothetical protein [Actinomycetota bacterium]
MATDLQGRRVPQIVQPQPLGKRIGAAMLVELGDHLVGGTDARLEPAGDELRLAQRPTQWRGEDQILPGRAAGQVGAQLVGDRARQPDRAAQ